MEEDHLASRSQETADRGQDMDTQEADRANKVTVVVKFGRCKGTGSFKNLSNPVPFVWDSLCVGFIVS